MKTINDSQIRHYFTALFFLFCSFIVEAAYDPEQHHYLVKQQLASWVDVEAIDADLSPVDALNAVKHRYGTDFLTADFYEKLKQQRWQFLSLNQALSSRQIAVLNEAAVLFFNAHHPKYIHHELSDLPSLRQKFLKALRYQLELYPVEHNVEQHYFARYYGDDFMKASILSVALQLYKERFGEQRAIENLSYQIGIRRTDSFVRWLINLFTHRQTNKIREAEKALLDFLVQEIQRWELKFDLDGEMVSLAHPYARVAAYAKVQKLAYRPLAYAIAHHTGNEAVLRLWYDALEALPNSLHSYSHHGQTLTLALRRAMNLPHHESHEYLNIAFLAVGIATFPEGVGELILGRIAQETVFSEVALVGAEVASEAHALAAEDLAVLESIIDSVEYTMDDALEESLITNPILVGEHIGDNLYHYAGADGVSGMDYVIEMSDRLHRIRRFPHTEDFALYQGYGSFGQFPVKPSAAGLWGITISESFENWTTSGLHRHVLLLGKGKPASLFKRYATSVQTRYGIPASNFYSDGHAVSGELRHIYPALGENKQLSHLTFSDRLDIVAHGNPYGPVSFNSHHLYQTLSAPELAKQLHFSGLREVGVLKLQSCNVGGGYYVKQLAQALDRHGIRVGFISAPKGYLVQLPRLPRMVFDPFPTFSADRYEVYATGKHIGFPNTRYGG